MEITEHTIKKLYSILLKDGLHSQSIFYGVKDKADFSNIYRKGKIFNSTKLLLNAISGLSHFTPNTYKGSPIKTAQNGLYGFTEQNLKQVNAFVVDIDNLSYSLQDILLACLDFSIGAPTMVLRTPNGHQVYFVLDKPIHISKNRNYHSLNVAKRISLNLKESLESVEADRYCNDVGFFRAPTISNIVWLQLDATFSPEDLMNWSIKKDDDLDRSLYAQKSNQAHTSYLQSEALQHILGLQNIKGHEGQLGRNNSIFTIALACYADGLSQIEAAGILTKFNRQLNAPIKQNEVDASIRSAFSGRYSGPNKVYLDEILALYSDYAATSTTGNSWYKFKKDRDDRKYSHFSEWESDIINYLDELEITESPYVELTQKQLCAIIGCQQSSLNAILKTSKKIIKTTVGKGRAAITKWATIKRMAQFASQCVSNLKETKHRYTTAISGIVGYDNVNLIQIPIYMQPLHETPLVNTS